MKCSDARKYMDQAGWGDKRLRDPELVSHLKRCELCRRYYEDTVLKQALSEMPVPEPDPDFSSRVIGDAINRCKKRRKKRIFTWVAAAAVIMMAIFAGRIFEFAGIQPLFSDNQPAWVIMAPGEEKVINILIEADKARQGAVFTVDLGGDIALTNIPDRRRLRWRADIVKGNNLLEIPVKMKDSQGGRLRVGYRFNGIENNIEVVVRPADKNSEKNKAAI